jgi:anaerobic magnesium-protoporphyrin IX monomethyl ester cyclase
MRILLINPLSNKLFERFLPLGLAYIAGSLIRKGHDITVWDINAEGWSREEVLNKIKETGGSYQLIGISALAGDYKYVRWLSYSIKKTHPEAKIIMGGYLASALPEFLLERFPIDYVAVGEGEETMAELANSVANGSGIGQVKGIYFKDGSGNIAATPARLRLENLDKLPFPPWEYFPMESYLRDRHISFGEHNEDGSGMISIMASRGCPFNCDYCDHTIKGHRVRYRTVKNVVEEIRLLLAGYGDKIGKFYFWDDILIWDRDWIFAFCETLLQEGIDIKWTCNCHVSRVEPRLMAFMKRAGCVNVRFGVESGSQRILDALNKGVKVEVALEALNVCLDAGLELTIYIMIGMSGENEETVGETLKFFQRLNSPLFTNQIRKVNFFMLTPFPGTRLFEKIKEMGLVRDMDDFLNRGFDTCYDIPVNISGLADQDLIRLKKDLENGVRTLRHEEAIRFNDLLKDMKKELEGQ